MGPWVSEMWQRFLDWLEDGFVFGPLPIYTVLLLCSVIGFVGPFSHTTQVLAGCLGVGVMIALFWEL